ncbi:DUF4935 domain-containing protein [Cryobacterium frigoriphilum]|uniref:DUF4935 domain-containing protein n=1 Tax=Cryobacterium frigoriphilum TaxID=1259150 RepID=A0A4R8ZTN9_9MICO|nr:PIN domain-containing protein [Cryobacterium frigoriphilum]TFD45380.1 DUF4935 domain-containing protein [Cryobacterium frigoriphilum]
MITVILDSNAFYGARWLTSIAGQNLIGLAAAGSCQVALPRVVVDELERQHREALGKQRDEAKAALSEVESLVNIDDIRAKFDQLLDEVSVERDALLARTGIRAAPVPANITRDLVDRDLQRRRPFIETGKKKSLGFRDAVIWETLLETVALDESEDTNFFVTRDVGFLTKNVSEQKLHADLLRDLDDRGMGRDRVVVIDTLANVVEAVNAAVAAAEAEAAEAKAAANPLDEAESHLASLLRVDAVAAAHRAELVRVATGALEALVGKEINDELGYGGDYRPPDFVHFDYPSAMESAMIVAIDLESNFIFDPPNGDIVTARADVILSIEGNTYKADYFMNGDDDVELVGELNDHYFETSTSIRARSVIEIEIEGGSGRFQSTDIVLEDNPNPSLSGEPSSVELDFNLEVELDPQLDLAPGDPGDPSELTRDQHD